MKSSNLIKRSGNNDKLGSSAMRSNNFCSMFYGAFVFFTF